VDFTIATNDAQHRADEQNQRHRHDVGNRRFRVAPQWAVRADANTERIRPDQQARAVEQCENAEPQQRVDAAVYQRERGNRHKPRSDQYTPQRQPHHVLAQHGAHGVRRDEGLHSCGVRDHPVRS
jgi:hypothetical protein